MLLNLCGKLIQRTNLCHLSAMRDPKLLFFLTVTFSHRTTGFILWLNQQWNDSLEVCQRLLRICQKYACFRRLFPSPFFFVYNDTNVAQLLWHFWYRDLAEPSSEGVSRHTPVLAPGAPSTPCLCWHAQEIPAWWRGGRPAWQSKGLFEMLQNNRVKKSVLTM